MRAVDEFLRLAVEQRATDLHVEPFSTGLQVRLRIDGLLKPIPAPPMSMAKGILSRLKIMAGLNITERRMPQDGRARVLMNGSEIDLRVATMPTMHGESAVVRLLRKGSGVVALDKLGLSSRGEAILRGVLNAPFGMIIVTGPTGSGKTTTLAASLAEINDASRKILTVEDPIEYQIPGINQTQVHPTIGLTFASALRSFLRQDPDVIMVGEMRDSRDRPYRRPCGVDRPPRPDDAAHQHGGGRDPAADRPRGREFPALVMRSRHHRPAAGADPVRALQDAARRDGR